MSMVQFNLLPDVKLEYIKTRRLKRLMVTISIIFAGACLTVAVLLFLAVNVLQKKHLNDLDKDITAAASQVQRIPDIDKIITVQNQLTSLPALHDDKPAAKLLFGYLAQVTPANVTFSNVMVDFPNSTFTVTGLGKTFLDVNTFVDTLKFTTYTDKEDPEATPKVAFSKVLLTSFSTTDKGATYTVEFSFDPSIFDNDKSISLTVPKTITTRSQINQPNALFQPNPAPATNKQGAE